MTESELESFPMVGYITDHLAQLHLDEDRRSSLSYVSQKKNKSQVSSTPEPTKKELLSSRDLHNMKILQRKLNNMMRREALANKFRQELNSSEKMDPTLTVPEPIHIMEGDFHKPWLSLTNDERANRINEYVLYKYKENASMQGQVRCILLRGITGKLLEPTSVTYDLESACILDIPCLQYNTIHNYFYFL